MLPIILTPQVARIGLAGQGKALGARARLLDEAGITRYSVFENRVPTASELAGLDILFVAGLDESASRGVYAKAKESSVLVNVEDVPKLCDFHVPAQIRRGELLITVSTGGRSPGLAAHVRDAIGEIFGSEWEARIQEVAVARARWRASGLQPQEVAKRTQEMLEDKGWLGRASQNGP